MVEVVTLVGLAIVAFAGGAFGAAIGGLPAFSFAGLIIVVGEAAKVGLDTATAPGEPAALGATGITASLGLGPGFGPHVAFAGGLAAAAFAARQGYMDTGFDYHEAKNITYALGTRPDVLVVGGAFGVVGLLVARGSVALSLPWDPIALAIVVSGFLHRIAFGYPLIGDVRADILDMSPFERGERRGPVAGSRAGDRTRTDGGVEPAEREAADRRFLVEPWLPHQYRWPNVALLGALVGVFGAFVTYGTGSPFLAFGITAASLVFLCLGMENMPVTHHMAFPASLAVLGLAGATDPGLLAGGVAPAEFQEAVALPLAVVVGAIFGLVGGLVGELAQRVLYAHADTHLDPPAASIVITTLLVALLDIVGVFAQNAIPTLTL